MKTLKSVLNSLFYLGIILGFAGCFYAGMYFNASMQSPTDQKEIMMAAIENAMKSTEDQPIIVIEPEKSLVEKTKEMFGKKAPERETVHMTLDVATKILKDGKIAMEDEPGKVHRAYLQAGEFGKKAWESTKSSISGAYNWASEKLR